MIYTAKWIATADEKNQWQVLDNAACVVLDGKIAWLGKTEDIPKKYQGLAHKDFGSKGILPGFIDCHTHMIFAGNRSNEFVLRQQGYSYADIQAQGGGIYSTVRATRAASFQTLYDLGKQRITQALRQGVTTFEIKSGYGLNLEAEQKMLEVAKQLSNDLKLTIHKTFLGAHVKAPEFHDNKSYLHYLSQEVFPVLAKKGLVDSVDAFCESIAFSAQELESFFQVCSESAPVRIHADQLSQTGAVGLACQFKALSIDHAEYTSATELAKLKENGTAVVLLPGAFYHLRETQRPPIKALREQQIPFAVASDYNPGSSPILNFPLIMNLACSQFSLTVEEVFVSVTANAAKVLGLANKGKLKPKFDADFTVWDIEHPADLVAQIKPWQCHEVVVKGEVYDINSI